MWVRGLKLCLEGHCMGRDSVAPYVGAWIETLTQMYHFCLIKSHPMWVRGLKQGQTLLSGLVAQSHPMWVRGLKHQESETAPESDKSHPMWVRGLKLCPERH